MDTMKPANLPSLKIHLLITLAQKELHSCRYRGFGNQASNKFPLALFHIIPLLSASCSSPNVLGPSGPLSSMTDGFRLEKWPSIYHCGAPVPTTEAPLFPSTGRKSDIRPCLGPTSPTVLGGTSTLWALRGGEERLSHFHFPCKAFLVCGDPTMFSSPQWPIPAIIHPPLCSLSLSCNHVIHHLAEF